MATELRLQPCVGLSLHASHVHNILSEVGDVICVYDAALPMLDIEKFNPVVSLQLPVALVDHVCRVAVVCEVWVQLQHRPLSLRSPRSGQVLYLQLREISDGCRDDQREEAKHEV